MHKSSVRMRSEKQIFNTCRTSWFSSHLGKVEVKTATTPNTSPNTRQLIHQAPIQRGSDGFKPARERELTVKHKVKRRRTQVNISTYKCVV